MSLEWCNECWTHHFNGAKCFPRFEVLDEDDGDWTPIRAIDAEEAAETWAERSDADSAEYHILSGYEPTVTVRDEDGNVTRWRVSGESEPQYRAKEIESTEGK